MSNAGAGVSGAVVLLLRHRLKHVLDDLCGTPERSAFWTSLTSVLLILTPLAFALLPQYDEASTAENSLVALKWSLFGLIVSLLILAIVIARFAVVDVRKRSSPPAL